MCKLNFVPFPELASMSIQLQSSDTSVLRITLRAIIKFVHYDQKYPDVFRAVGAVDGLISILTAHLDALTEESYDAEPVPASGGPRPPSRASMHSTDSHGASTHTTTPQSSVGAVGLESYCVMYISLCVVGWWSAWPTHVSRGAMGVSV